MLFISSIFEWNINPSAWNSFKIIIIYLGKLELFLLINILFVSHHDIIPEKLSWLFSENSKIQ